MYLGIQRGIIHALAHNRLLQFLTGQLQQTHRRNLPIRNILCLLPRERDIQPHIDSVHRASAAAVWRTPARSP